MHMIINNLCIHKGTSIIKIIVILAIIIVCCAFVRG